MNPEEQMLAEDAVYGIRNKQREEAFERHYGRKSGRFTDRKQW